MRPSHRVTGNRRDSVDGAGWEVAHVAIDDHSRAGFVQVHADEKKTSAVDFLKAAVAHRQTARRSASFRPACASGLTPEATPTAQNEPPGCQLSLPTTTADDPTLPSTTNLQLLALAETTYCNLTSREPLNKPSQSAAMSLS